MAAGILDPRLILTGQKQVPLNDLASVYRDAAGFREAQLKLDAMTEEQRANQAMNDAYRQATNPDGSVDQSKLMAALAQSGVGSKIPGAQKAQADLLARQAATKKDQADTGKTMQETLHGSLKLVDNSIASLAANPNTTDKDVYAEVGRLVNAGAFNVQAAQQGKSPDDYARDMLSTMPVGNPQALKGWLIQAGSRVADASKRLELMLPKYDEQDRGGVINQGTINQMTGERTAGANITKSATPDAVLGADTTRRGQDLRYKADSEASQIAKEAQQSQVIETPQGFQVVNKGTGVARPVMQEGGSPVLSKDSQVAKNAQMANRMNSLIPMAREMLNSGPTASGSGAAADKVMNFLGYSTKGSDTATALEAVSGWLTSNVPRFEGPQSDKDTDTYRTMAGRVGDRTLPIATRLEALNTIEKITAVYNGQGSLPFSGPPGTQPATVVAPRPSTPRGYTGPERRGAPAAVAPAQRPSLDSFFHN